MSDPQSLHKYAYVHGDPVQGVDPTGQSLGGLAGIGLGLGITAGLGAIAGAGVGGVIAAHGWWTGRMSAGAAVDTVQHYATVGAFGGLGIGAAITSIAFAPIPALSLLGAGSILSFYGGDELFAGLPYFPGFRSPDSWISQLKQVITVESRKQNLPPELVASVLLYELDQYNIGDTLVDLETMSGRYHSIGIAQLRIDNVQDWVPSSAGMTDATIRDRLLNPRTAVAMLAEAIGHIRTTKGNPVGLGVTSMSWPLLTQQRKEQLVFMYASAKDVPFGETNNAASNFGVPAFRRIQAMQLFRD